MVSSSIPTITIKGWPETMEHDEIKSLLETVGTLTSFECEKDQKGGILCHCKYETAKGSDQARKGFHQLSYASEQQGEVTLTVEVDGEEEGGGGSSADDDNEKGAGKAKKRKKRSKSEDADDDDDDDDKGSDADGDDDDDDDADKEDRRIGNAGVDEEEQDEDDAGGDDEEEEGDRRKGRRDRDNRASRPNDRRRSRGGDGGDDGGDKDNGREREGRGGRGVVHRSSRSPGPRAGSRRMGRRGGRGSSRSPSPGGGGERGRKRGGGGGGGGGGRRSSRSRSRSNSGAGRDGNGKSKKSYSRSPRREGHRGTHHHHKSSSKSPPPPPLAGRERRGEKETETDRKGRKRSRNGGDSPSGGGGGGGSDSETRSRSNSNTSEKRTDHRGDEKRKRVRDDDDDDGVEGGDGNHRMEDDVEGDESRRDEIESKDGEEKKEGKEPAQSPVSEATKAEHGEGGEGGGGEKPVRKKKSRFAPPPAGAQDLVGAMSVGALSPAGSIGSGAATEPLLHALQIAALKTVPGGLNVLPGMLQPAGMNLAQLGGIGLAGLLPKGSSTTFPTMGGTAAVQALPPALLAAANNPELKAQLELFIGNIPLGCTQVGLLDFLNAAMKQIKLNLTPGDACVSCRLSSKFAFCVFRTVEEATNAVKMTGIPYGGNFLKIQRPSSYKGPADPPITWQQLTGQQVTPAAVVQAIANPIDKIYRELFVGNLPTDLQPQVLKEYISSAALQVGLVKDDDNPIISVRYTPGSRFAFVEYKTPEQTTAFLNMDGIPFGTTALSFARPSKYPGVKETHKTWFDVLAEGNFMGGAAAGGSGDGDAATRVVKIGNVVTEEELRQDSSFVEVLEDMREECSKYGSVTSLEIPRPGSGGGVGFVFVQFEDMNVAAKAKASFESRTFDGKSVTAVYYPEEKYLVKDFTT